MCIGSFTVNLTREQFFVGREVSAYGDWTRLFHIAWGSHSRYRRVFVKGLSRVKVEER